MNYIRTNSKWARQRGTTLIELSVVIAVILLLVGVLFISVAAWRDGANRSACIVNMSSLQKAMRGFQNMNQLDFGAAIANTALTTTQPNGGEPFYAVMPTCPVGLTVYTLAATIPATGVQYATCAAAGNGAPHTLTAAQTANW